MGEVIQNFVFDGDEPHGLRVVMRDGEPWFVAKDVCAVLEHSNYRMAVEPLDDDEKGVSSIYTLGGEQSMLIVSEGGLYTLILRSRLATSPGSVAHRFRKWVTGELLPLVRRTGHYAPNVATDWDWDLIGAKVQLVREARLAHGRRAAAALWRVLALPEVESAGAALPQSSVSGIDIVQRFLNECTDADPRGEVQARVLSTRYAEWARATNAPAMTERALALSLERLGVPKTRGRVHVYLGVRVRGAVL